MRVSKSTVPGGTHTFRVSSVRAVEVNGTRYIQAKLVVRSSDTADIGEKFFVRWNPDKPPRFEGGTTEWEACADFLCKLLDSSTEQAADKISELLNDDSMEPSEGGRIRCFAKSHSPGGNRRQYTSYEWSPAPSVIRYN